MINRDELIQWLQTLPQGSNVGIDEGGLTLRCDEDAEAYNEIGGMPEEDEEDEPKRISCDQCEMLAINGVACHEIGCTNMHAKWNAERGQWVKYVDCFECGYEVEVGTSCGCLEPVEDEEPEEDEDDDDEA